MNGKWIGRGLGRAARGVFALGVCLAATGCNLTEQLVITARATAEEAVLANVQAVIQGSISGIFGGLLPGTE